MQHPSIADISGLRRLSGSKYYWEKFKFRTTGFLKWLTCFVKMESFPEPKLDTINAMHGFFSQFWVDVSGVMYILYQELLSRMNVYLVLGVPKKGKAIFLRSLFKLQNKKWVLENKNKHLSLILNQLEAIQHHSTK